MTVLTLPSRYYTAPELFELEKTKIFYRFWQYVGHISIVKQPGDYFTCTIADQNLIVIRGQDDVVRAFYNVCPHRANELLVGDGNTRAIVCLYHAWTFGADGQVWTVPNSENVPQFDPSRYCLKSVKLEIFYGFIFVNLDANATSLKSQTGSLESEAIQAFENSEEFTLVHSTSVKLKANWKVVVENYSECYHCPVVHPSSSALTDNFDVYKLKTEGIVRRYYDYEGEQETGLAGWYLWPNIVFWDFGNRLYNTINWIPVDTDHTLVVTSWYVSGAASTEQQKELIDKYYHKENVPLEDARIVESVQRGLKSFGYDYGPLMIDAKRTEKSEHGVQQVQDLVRQALGID